jgi:hypothetical protein
VGGKSTEFKELLYASMPYSLNQYLVKRKCCFSEQDKILRDSRLVIYPPTLDIKEIVTNELDKAIAFLPYCAKPLGDKGCPVSDSVYARKNQKCLKLDGKCNVPCSLGNMIDVLKKHGYTKDRIFIIDSESNLFPWLKKKRKEGYKYFFPGVGCYYGVGYALNRVEKELGFTGCIAFLDDYDPNDKKNGVCRGIHDYMNMDTKDKGKRTRISDESIRLIEKILSGEYEVSGQPENK